MVRPVGVGSWLIVGAPPCVFGFGGVGLHGRRHMLGLQQLETRLWRRRQRGTTPTADERRTNGERRKNCVGETGGWVGRRKWADTCTWLHPEGAEDAQRQTRGDAPQDSTAPNAPEENEQLAQS